MLVTAHRRENFGRGIAEISCAVHELATRSTRIVPEPIIDRSINMDSNDGGHRMRRLDSSEMRSFWEQLSASWDPARQASDPEALGNICRPGAPAWLNRFEADKQ